MIETAEIGDTVQSSWNLETHVNPKTNISPDKTKVNLQIKWRRKPK